jgi:hypothetical protein
MTDFWRDHCPASQGKKFQDNVNLALAPGGSLTISYAGQQDPSAQPVHVQVKLNVGFIAEGQAATIEGALEAALAKTQG